MAAAWRRSLAARKMAKWLRKMVLAESGEASISQVYAEEQRSNMVGASAGGAATRSRRQRRWRYDCSSIFELKKIQWVRLGGGEGRMSRPSICKWCQSLNPDNPIRACRVVGDRDLGLEWMNGARAHGIQWAWTAAGAGRVRSLYLLVRIVICPSSGRSTTSYVLSCRPACVGSHPTSKSNRPSIHLVPSDSIVASNPSLSWSGHGSPHNDGLGGRGIAGAARPERQRCRN